jgi:hypothetical protein
MKDFVELGKARAFRAPLLTAGVGEPSMAAFHKFRNQIGGGSNAGGANYDDDFGGTIVRNTQVALALLHR